MKGRIACIASLLVGLGASAEPVPYVVENYAIPTPLTTTPGDPERGRALVLDRSSGNCVTCHAFPLDAEFFGTTGPSLVGVARRLDPAQLRLRVVDPKVVNPMTMMPAYHRTAGLRRVAPRYAGEPILDAQQVEDVVAYLSTLN